MLQIQFLVVHASNFQPRPTKKFLLIAMVSTSCTVAFIVLVEAWVDQLTTRSQIVLEKLEVIAEMCTKIVRALGASSLSKIFIEAWIYSRRAICVLRGIEMENTLDINKDSLGAIPLHQKGLRVLKELPQHILESEIKVSLQMIQELEALSTPGSELGVFLNLFKEQALDIQIVLRS